MISRSSIYLVLTIVGFAVPNLLILLYVRDNGWYLDVNHAEQLLSGSKLILAVVAQLGLAYLTFFFWMFREARKHDISPSWAYVIYTFVFGLSFSFPLFLFVRQKRRDALNPKV